MSLKDEYQRQFGWRSWPTIFNALPSIQGQIVLDLGCAVGDQSAELLARGARVIGYDTNEELLQEAQSRGLMNAEFRKAELRMLPDLDISVDGIWCSFAAAYFPDLPAVVAGWTKLLRNGGWIALTEVDDLFGHQPLSRRAKELMDDYARDALDSSRYDFHMGRKLAAHSERAGLVVSQCFTVEDQEFSFRGPAQPEVVGAWQRRFDRMGLLRDFCGIEFEKVRDEFLGCLLRIDHWSAAKVYACIAIK